MKSEEPTKLLSREQIRSKVEELAERISEDYADSENLILVCILKGAFLFFADLCRLVRVPHCVEFMALSSYGTSKESSGEVRMIMDLNTPIEGKDVLLVEDIVETGKTLDVLLKRLAARNPASLKCCVLLDKPCEDRPDFPIEYRGFEIPRVWVVGYGLDSAEAFRSLDYVGFLE